MSFMPARVRPEDRQHFALDRVLAPPLYRAPAEVREFLVDRDREAFLAWTRGGDEEAPNEEHFALGLAGQVIAVTLRREARGRFDQHCSLRWSLVELRLPDAPTPPRPEVLDLLKEALRAYGVGLGVPVASLDLSFDF